jgi:hypothetical protein
VVAGNTQQFTATGLDQNGNALATQPAFSWTVSGGGGISSSGSFTAGSSTGGPYTVTASANGKSGTASVTVVVSSGGTIGHTGEGMGTDILNDANGNHINVSRFQASSALYVTSIKAKVKAITGSYQCAIYSDNSGSPGTLLVTSAQVTNPGADGWQTFALQSTQYLQSGSHYWLAIWSDNINAAVYYNSASGTLRWTAGLTYGTWPITLSTVGSSNYQYCIYAVDLGSSTSGNDRPVTNNLLEVSRPVNISIFNNAGELVRTVTGREDRLDDLFNHPALPNGLYFYNITGGKAPVVKKVLLLQ